MVRILYAPPSADLCGEAVRHMAREGERFFLVVPRHYSHECERKLCEVLGDSASTMAEVVSLDRLYTRVATECGGAAERFIDDAGRLLLTYTAAQRIATQMRAFSSELRKPEFLAEASTVIEEFRSCRVDPSALMRASELAERELGDRLHDLALLAEAYAAEVERNDMSPSRVLALEELLARTGWAEDKRFAFYGYTEFTAEELEVLRVLTHSRELAVTLGCERACIAPELGEFDPLYTYARTAERVRRIAESEGVDFAQEDAVGSTPLPDALRFIERDLMRDASAEFDGDASAVELASESSIWSECERAAAWILSRVREDGWHFRDFAVALPQNDEYRAAVEAVFDSWEIPVFLDRTDDALSAPIISAITAVLDILRSGFTQEDVLRYLKSGLSPLGFDAACELENYAFTWSIRGGAWLRDFTGNPRGFSVELRDEDARLLERLNEHRREIVEPLVSFRERIRPGDAYYANEHLRELYALLTELRIDTRIAHAANEYAAEGDLQTANEYAQLWGKICDLIDEFSALAGNEMMKFDEFSRLFELLLGGVSVGTIPPSLDEVAVGETGRLRHRSPKALLLLGAVAGSFPPPTTSGGLLDDHDREALAELDLGLEPSSRRLAWRSLNTAYAALTLPSERLYVSWAPTAEGGAATVSPLVLQLAEKLGIKPQPASRDERLLSARRPALELALRALNGGEGYAKAALEYFERNGSAAPQISAARAAISGERGPLSAEAASALYGDLARLTASRSDQFMGCAFSHFMNYGLRADPHRPAELGALESGTLIHAVLENAVRRISDEGHLGKEIGDKQRAEAQSIAKEELESYITARLGEAATFADRTKHLFGRIEQNLERVIDSIMDEFAASDFRPEGFEVGFGTEGARLEAVNVGENGKLVGVVDRVDSWNDPETNIPYFRVVDYKSGKKLFDYTDIYHGVSLQLPIYLHALRSYAESQGIDASAAGAFYSPAAEPFYSGARGESDEKIAEAVEKQERRSGVYLLSPEVETALEHGGAQRFLPPEPQYKLTKRQFELLERHVTSSLADTAKRILDGEIEAKPSVRGQFSVCSYCDFRHACRFDPTGGSDRERLRFTVGHSDFWSRLEGKFGADIPKDENEDKEASDDGC